MPAGANSFRNAVSLCRSYDFPLSNALVSFESTMEAMDMGTGRVNAQSKGNGLYLAQTQFSMHGSWRVKALITEPGRKMEIAVFEIATQ